MSLRFNEEKVAQELMEFVSRNPAAAPELVERRKNELIVRETVYAIWQAHHARFNADGKDAESFEAELRSGQNTGARKALAYFTKSDPVRLDYLEKFQQLSEADEQGSFLNEFDRKAFTTLTVALGAQNNVTLTETGDEYLRGLFAPVTESDGMLFDGLDPSASVTSQMLRDTQAESDAIRIAVPENMNAELVTFVVMGEFFRDRHLGGMAEYLLDKGSTIPKGYSPTANTIATFFEDTIISELRPNMHACRLMVPGARRAAREIVEGGRQEEIRANLKNAFDVLYSRAVYTTGISKPVYCFSVRQADALVQALRQSGMEPAELGITEVQLTRLTAMKKVVDFQIETQQLRQSLQKDVADYYFNGFPAELDVLGNEDKLAQIYELAARNDFLESLRADLASQHGLYSVYGLDKADEHISERELIGAEQRLLRNDPELLNDARRYVRGGRVNADIQEKLATPLGRMDLLNGSIQGASHSVDSPLPVYIRSMQADALKVFEDYAKARGDAQGILSAVEAVRKAAASVTPESGWEELATLTAPYTALRSASSAYLKRFTPEQMKEKENYHLNDATLVLNSLLRCIAEEPRRVAAQAEFNRSRAALRESVKDDALKYDHARAEERMNAFRQTHPNAGAAELRNGEIEIIAEEAMLYARLSAYERLDPDGKDILSFRAREQEYRSAQGVFRNELLAAQRLTGEARLRFAAGYQKNLEALKTQKELNSFPNLFSSLNSDPVSKAITGADGVFNALFSPKTDHSGILMGNFDDSGITKTAEILAWQKDTDEIEIPVPNDLHPSLVSFLVLGRTTRNDLLLAASPHIVGDGSTLPKDYRKEANVLVSFWDSLMTRDPRGNMHCIRSVVPQARREVRDMILKRNEAAVKDTLRNAFDVMYNQIIAQDDHTLHPWFIPMQKLGELMTGLEQSGLTPESIGIEPEKLERYRALVPGFELVREKQQVDAAMQESMYRYFESGFDPALDPTKDTPARALLERKAALAQATTDFFAEMRSFRSGYGFMGLNYVDDVAMIRDLNPYEKMCAEDPAAFRELMLRQVHRSFDKKLSEVADTPEAKLSLMEKGVGESHPYIPNQSERERTVVTLQLERVHGYLISGKFDGMPGVNGVREELMRLLELRQGNDYSLERMQSFVEPYRHMSDTLLRFVYSLPEELQDSVEGTFIETAGNTLNSYIAGIGREPERLRFNEQEAADFAELKRGLTPSFMDRYAAYRGTMEAIGPGSNHPEEYRRMLRSMDALTDRLSSLCGEGKRDTLLTRNDGQTLRGLYSQALRDCTDYINLRGTDALKSDRVFMATELQSLLAQNLRFFDKLGESREITLSEALKSRYGGRVGVDDALSRFTAAAAALEQVSSAFGGNSEEFENMKEALYAFRGKNIDKQKLLELSDTLNRRSEAYISAKKVIPSTEQGKRRLQIARQVRELCGELKNAYNWEYFGTRQADSGSYEQKLERYLEERETAALGGMKKAVQGRERERYKEQLSELLYLRDVHSRLFLEGAGLAEALKGDAFRQGVTKLNGEVDKLLEAVPPAELNRAFHSPDPIRSHDRLFASFRAVSAPGKGGAAADRADNLLASKRPGLKL